MKHRHGYAIPLSLCVASVTLLMGIAATQLTAGDLQNATQQYYQERARQVADYGLECCVANGLPPQTNLTLAVSNVQVRQGTFTLDSVSGTHSEDRVVVTIFDNRGGDLDESASGCPVASVPAGFQYWVAEGQARENGRVLSSARLGAMVRYGMPVGGAGAQVHFMCNHATQAVGFSAQNLATGQPADDEILFATNSTTPRPLGSPLPPPALPPVPAPLALNRVAALEGKVRIPVGKPDSWVHSDSALSPGTIDKEGGEFNVPDYTPPALRRYFPTHTATAAETEILQPGRYGRWLLPAGAQLRLAGPYHVQELVVQGSTQDAAALLHSVGPTRLYVDKISTTAGGPIALRNTAGPSARAFQMYLKPGAEPQNLTLHAERRESLSGSASSSVLVVAPAYNLRVKADADNRIAGSFCCEELDLFFQGAGAPSFVYDVSANQARRRRAPGDNSSPGEDESLQDNRTGGQESVDEGDGQDGEPQNPDGEAQNANRTEPFILSKQPL